MHHTNDDANAFELPVLVGGAPKSKVEEESCYFLCTERILPEIFVTRCNNLKKRKQIKSLLATFFDIKVMSVT